MTDAYKHKLLSENDDYFELESPDGSSFKVVKNSVDAMTRKKIASLKKAEKYNCGGMVKGYADGGMAEMQQPIAEQTQSIMPDGSREIATEEYVPPQPQSLPAQVGQGVGKYLVNPIKEGAEGTLGAFSSLGSGLVNSAKDFVSGVAQGSGLPKSPTPNLQPASLQQPQIKKVSDEEKVGLPSQPNQAPGTPGQPQEQPKSPYDAGVMMANNMKAIDDATKAYQGAIGQIGKTYVETDNLYRQSMQREAEYREKMNKQSQAMELAAQSNKVNPSNYWENKSSLGKITAGIGVILGGIGQGLMRSGSNAGYDALKSAIDQDIQAQKANIDQQNNLLSKNYEMTKDMVQAEALTRSQLTAWQAGKVQQLLNMNTLGPEQKMRAEQLKLNLVQQYVGINSELSQRQTMADMARGSATPDQILSLPQEKQALTVQMPDGKYYLATTPEGAKELRNKVTSNKSIFDVISKLEQLGPEALIGKKRDEAKFLVADLKSKVMERKDIKKENPALAKMVEAMSDDPSSLSEHLGLDANKNSMLRKSFESELFSEAESNLPNYRRPFTPTPTRTKP